MRRIKFFEKIATMLLILLVCMSCVAMTACSDSSGDGTQADTISDDDKFNPEQTDPTYDPSKEDPVVYPEEEGDGYRHEVAGVVFYTEHDINQWLTVNEKGHSYIDLGAMLHDVWCEHGGGIIQSEDGFLFTDGDAFTKSVLYELDEKLIIRRVKIEREIGDTEYRTDVACFIDGPSNKVKGGYYGVVGTAQCIHPEAAEVLLYLVEQIEANPRNDIASELGLDTNAFGCD